jgi:hypothetical protein
LSLAKVAKGMAETKWSVGKMEETVREKDI